MLGGFSLVATVAGILIIPSQTTLRQKQGLTAKASVDWLGAFLVTAGLLALLFALTEANVVGWSTPWVPVLIVVSVLLIALFVLWQVHLEKRGGPSPLMKVSIFRSTQFSAAMLIMCLYLASFTGYLVYATYYFQEYQGYSAIQTTLRFIPTGVMGVIVAVVVSRLIAIIPTWMVLLFGTICISASNILFAAPIPTDTSYFAFGLEAMVLSVLGADAIWPCLTLFTSSALPPEDQALGGGLVNAAGQIGRSVGLAIQTAVQTAVMARARGQTVKNAGPMLPWDDATLKGIQAAQWSSVAMGLVAAVTIIVALRGTGIVGKAGVKPKKKKETVVVENPAPLVGEKE